GENPADYREQADLIPQIAHLPPPIGCPPVAMMRFSPMHKEPERFGLRDVRPHEAYAQAFGPHASLTDFAYVFEYERGGGLDPEKYAEPTLEAARRWRLLGALRRPRCEAVRFRGRRFVVDSRRSGTVGLALPRVVKLSQDEWALLERL